MSSSDSTEITNVTPVPMGDGEIIPEAIFQAPLTLDEDNFALAFVEFGGNVRKAWDFAYGNTADPMLARAVLSQANVALRIRQLQELDGDAMMISMGSHLIELARIRDLALDRGETKVGLDAEVKRGEAAGIYAKNNKKSLDSTPNFTFVINNKNDVNI